MSGRKKAWNGGSVERALELAREINEKLIAQGGWVRCDECAGEGGTIHGVCIQCRGAGILPTTEDIT